MQPGLTKSRPTADWDIRVDTLGAERFGGLVVRDEREGSRVTPGWVESSAIALCRETQKEHHRGRGQ